MNILILSIISCVNTTRSTPQIENIRKGTWTSALDFFSRTLFRRSNSKQEEHIYDKIPKKKSNSLSRNTNYDINQRCLPELPIDINKVEVYEVNKGYYDRSASCPDCLLQRKRNNSESLDMKPRSRNNSESSLKCFYYKHLHNVFGFKEIYETSLQNDEAGYVIMHSSLSTLNRLKNDMEEAILKFQNNVIGRFDEFDDEALAKKNSFLLEVAEKLKLDFQVVLFEYAIEKDLAYVERRIECFKEQIKEALNWWDNMCQCKLCYVRFYE